MLLIVFRQGQPNLAVDIRAAHCVSPGTAVLDTQRAPDRALALEQQKYYSQWVPACRCITASRSDGVCQYVQGHSGRLLIKRGAFTAVVAVLEGA